MSKPRTFRITGTGGGQTGFPARGGQPGSQPRQRPGGQGARQLDGLVRLGAGAQGGAEPGGAAGVQREAAEAGELAQLVADRFGELGRDPFGVGQPGGDPRRPAARRAAPTAPGRPTAATARAPGAARPRAAAAAAAGRSAAGAAPSCPARWRARRGPGWRRGRPRCAACRGCPRGCRAPARRGPRRRAGTARRRSRPVSPRRTAPCGRAPPWPRSGSRSSGSCPCQAGRGSPGCGRRALSSIALRWEESASRTE